MGYSTELKFIEDITATLPQPFLKCFAIFKNAVHSLEPDSASHQAPNYAQTS